MTRTGTAAPGLLAATAAVVRPAIEQAVTRLDPELARIARYQLGLADADGRPRSDGGGKYLRPGLTLAGAAAAGVAETDALPGAVAVQLVHEFSLLHDDVMDGDRTRRHRPTAWVVFGPGPAIVAGDALLALAFELLLEQPRGRAAAAMLAAACRELMAGQAHDLALEGASEVDLDRCLEMASGKTAALLGASAAIGAVLGGAPPAHIDALERFGRHLGVAFQAIDDLLGIWGDPQRTGKPQGGDLRQRKRTLPVVAALEVVGPPLLVLLDAAADGQPAAALDVLERAGARDTTLTIARRHLDAALAALRAVPRWAGPTAPLEELARFTVDREV